MSYMGVFYMSIFWSSAAMILSKPVAYFLKMKYLRMHVHGCTMSLTEAVTEGEGQMF